VYALKYLTDMDKTYKIAMIQGQPGTEAFTLRMDGFEAYLRDHGVNFEVLAKLPCYDDFNTAGEQVETFTLANPDLDMWFFSGGWPLFLDPQSMPEFKKWHDKPDHWCITVDAFPPERAWFEAGLCEAAVSQNYYRMGEMTVEYLYKLIKGETLPPPDKVINNTTPWYATGSFPVTPENWREEFAKMRPW
jgi:ribose transport system substrate-binding protein